MIPSEWGPRCNSPFFFSIVALRPGVALYKRLEPSIRARLGTTARLCKAVVLKFTVLVQVLGAHRQTGGGYTTAGPKPGPKPAGVKVKPARRVCVFSCIALETGPIRPLSLELSDALRVGSNHPFQPPLICTGGRDPVAELRRLNRCGLPPRWYHRPQPLINASGPYTRTPTPETLHPYLQILLRGRATCHFMPRVFLLFSFDICKSCRECPQIIDSGLLSNRKITPAYLSVRHISLPRSKARPGTY